MFEKLANTVANNASTYKTLRACDLMAARLKRAYERDGSYGFRYHLYDNAMWEIRFRYQALLAAQRAA